jgi:hypothetical protein
LDQGLRNCSEHLIELDRVVSESEELGSVVISMLICQCWGRCLA